MKRTKLGSLDVTLAGGTDGEGGGLGPVALLLHGFGAPGEDLVPLWRVLGAPPGTRFVFPAGRLSLAPEGYGDGRAWWPIDMAALQRGEARLTASVPHGLAESRAAIESVLGVIENDWQVPASRTVIGGFSQGSMLALDVALRRSHSFAGVVVLSGTVIAEPEWKVAMSEPARSHAWPIFQSHGTNDPILPFALAESLRDALRAAGHDVTWAPFRGGHEIPEGVLQGVGRFLTRTLG